MIGVAQIARLALAFAMIGLLVYGAFALFGAIRKQLSGGGTGSGLEPGELDAIRGQLGEVDVLRDRVLELEERLDFAERLLADARTRKALPLPVDTPV